MTDTQIANLALGHLGSGKEIAELDSEDSAEAAAMRRFLPIAHDEVLRDFPWPFATLTTALSLVESDPNSEWSYSYQYPTACVNFRKILSGLREDSRQSRVPFRIEANRIFTDLTEAEGRFTINNYNRGHAPMDFYMALSFRLAAYAAPTVTGGDPNKLGDRALKLYIFELSRAQANSANEGQPDEEPDSEFGRARGSVPTKEYPARWR